MKKIETTISVPATRRELALGYDRRQSKPYARLRKER
jgi:hypothetical protein